MCQHATLCRCILEERANTPCLPDMVLHVCRTQAELIANTSIYIWAHGAAMAQTFFLPRVRWRMGKSLGGKEIFVGFCGS